MLFPAERAKAGDASVHRSPRARILILAAVAFFSHRLLRADPAPVVAAEKVTDTAGKIHSVNEPSAKATVWVFISHDCPICNAYAPEVNRIDADYSTREVTFNIVYCEVGLKPEDLAEHAKSRGFAGSLFYDGREKLAKLLGVDVTPEVAVIDRHGVLAYRGRIDDRYASPGTERPQASTRDLRTALDAILRDVQPPTTRTEAVGCSLETVN